MHFVVINKFKVKEYTWLSGLSFDWWRNVLLYKRKCHPSDRLLSWKDLKLLECSLLLSLSFQWTNELHVFFFFFYEDFDRWKSPDRLWKCHFKQTILAMKGSDVTGIRLVAMHWRAEGEGPRLGVYEDSVVIGEAASYSYLCNWRPKRTSLVMKRF